jgi:hypothetical protein
MRITERAADGLRTEDVMKALIGLLLLVGLLIAYWQWVLAVVVVVLAVKAAPVAWRELQAEQAAERSRLQGVIARADQQHQWTMR